MPGLRSGELDRRIVIEQATTTRSDSGAPVKTWSKLREVWAKAAYQGGKEFLAAAQVHAAIDAVFVIRAGLAIAITTLMRVRHGARVYDIVAVDDLSDKDRVRLVCKSGPRQGS